MLTINHHGNENWKHDDNKYCFIAKMDFLKERKRNQVLVRSYIIGWVLTRYTHCGKQYGSHLKIKTEELCDPSVYLLGITQKKYNPYFVKMCAHPYPLWYLSQ